MPTYDQRIVHGLDDARWLSNNTAFDNTDSILVIGQGTGKGSMPGYHNGLRFVGLGDVVNIQEAKLWLTPSSLWPDRTHTYFARYRDTSDPGHITEIPSDWSATYQDVTSDMSGAKEQDVPFPVDITNLLVSWRAAYPSADKVVIGLLWQSSSVKGFSYYHAYDGDPMKAARLVVEYTAPPPPAPPIIEPLRLGAYRVSITRGGVQYIS